MKIIQRRGIRFCSGVGISSKNGAFDPLFRDDLNDFLRIGG
jgi:hypothetical protein